MELNAFCAACFRAQPITKPGGLITKTLQIMNLTAFLLLIACLQVSAGSYSQQVSLRVKDAPLETVFSAIEKQTGYYFAYRKEVLANVERVTLDVKDAGLKEVIELCIMGKPLRYTITDRVISVRRIEVSAFNENTPLELFPIKGTVRDEKGQALVGVNVVVKGTKRGVISDLYGNFTIDANIHEVLIISSINYQTKEIKISAVNAPLIVTLAVNSSALDEVTVVNTGYEKIDSRKLTGAVTTVKMDSILAPGINTIDKLLEGRVPGMIFMQNSGQVGAAPRLRIRGTTTILGNREPLWVLDGIVLIDPVNVDPQQINDLDFVNLLGNAIAGLNPQDIDQIDVLKDASATALYGAKAGNGVIVITTKKGKVGKPTISYSGTTSFSRHPRYSDKSMNMMNSEERMDVSKEMVDRGMHYNNVTQFTGYEKALEDYYAGNIAYDEFKRLTDYYASVNTDWMGLLTQDAISQNHSLSLSGGAAGIKYYSSLGYQNENGAIKGENNKRYSSLMSISADYKKFSAQFSFTGNYSTRDYTPSDLGVMDYAYNTSRTIPAYNTDGSYFFYPKPISGAPFYNYNILKEKDNSGDRTDLISANIRTSIKYKVMKGLDVDGTFAYNASSNNRELYYTKDTYYIYNIRKNRDPRFDLAPVGGELQRSETRNNGYTARLQTNYNTFFGKDYKHSITASAGMETISSEYHGFNITRRGYFKELGGYFDAVPTSNSGYYQQWMSTKDALGSYNRQLTNTLAWYGTTGYSWDNRYIFNVHIRGEQSNLFGSRSNNKFLPIWALSGRWNMKQDVLKNVSWVNDLAMKASWGWQGNMLPGQSANMVIRQNPGTNFFYNSQYSTIVNFPNPDLKWERTSSSNVGLDFSLLGNKITGSLGYFYKKTKDAFLTKTVSDINGVESYVINSGTLENKGIEVSLSIKVIDNTGMNTERRGFVWHFDPQLGQVLNKVLNRAINNRNNVLVDNLTYNDFLAGTVQLAGKPLNTFYSYKFKGLSPVDGSPIFYGTEDGQAASYQQKYGSMKKEDVFLQVMSESGRREPFIQGGFSNYFGWRNFGLSFNLTYSLGNKIRLLKIASGYGTAIAYPQQNLRKEFVNRWRRPGDEAYTNIPGLQADNNLNMPWWTQYPATEYQLGGSIYELYDNSDIRLVSGDFLKLQSTSFRYNFANKLVQKLGLSAAYFSLTGTNLFIISNKMLKGQDPTQSGSTPNISLSLTPTYSGTLNISF